jgi:hypothetical protein
MSIVESSDVGNEPRRGFTLAFDFDSKLIAGGLWLWRTYRFSGNFYEILEEIQRMQQKLYKLLLKR